MWSSVLETFYLKIYNIHLFEIVLIFSVIFLSLLFRGLFSRFFIKKIKLLVGLSKNQVDDAVFSKLEKPLNFIPVIVFIFILNLYADSNSKFYFFLEKMSLTLGSVLIFWFLHNLVEPLTYVINKLEKFLTQALINWLIKSLKILFIFLGVVSILEIWGIKIGPILAGLGLLGVAVALGAQDLFKNLISGIMIITERRFKIGDVINVPDHCEGTVINIGFRSTLIEQFDSTPITIPNYIFAESPIINYSERKFRRINWVVGFEYKSTIEQLKEFTTTLEQYINSNDNFIVNDEFKCFVKLDKFNDSSIDILILCFTSTSDWDTYLQIKEELGIEIKKKATEIGLNFAFPSTSLYFENNLKREEMK